MSCIPVYRIAGVPVAGEFLFIVGISTRRRDEIIYRSAFERSSSHRSRVLDVVKMPDCMHLSFSCIEPPVLKHHTAC